jgi:hypothetical protein
MERKREREGGNIEGKRKYIINKKNEKETKLKIKVIT